MFMSGYCINDGSMTGLTRLQKIAILCMKQHRDKYYKSNKAILASLG